MSSRLLPGLALVASLPLLTAVAGGIIGSTLLGGGGMGWDELADFLGGMMVGGVLGLVAAVVLARTLQLRTLNRVAGGTCVAALLLVIWMAIKASTG